MMLIEFNEDIKKDLKLLLKNYTTIVKNDEDNKKIKEELCQIKKEIELHNRHFNEYQKQSLAAEIVRFADNLKRGHEKGRNSFKHIAECYNKYKELGGNHYIDEE
jgi:molecular chaperone GrpE (heat shock protein)